MRHFIGDLGQTYIVSERGKHVLYKKQDYERLSNRDIEEKLDIWWDIYPQIYDKYYRENISSRRLLTILESVHPNYKRAVDRIFYS